MRRLAAIVLALVAPLACSENTTVSYKPPFVPFQIEVDGKGNVRPSLTGEIVTPAGTFGITQGLGQDKTVEQETTLVYVYTYLAGELTASLFKVNTGEELGFSIDGKAHGTIRNGKMELTADPGRRTVIDVYDASTGKRGKGVPPPYTLLPPDWKFDLPNPLGATGWSADIDSRKVQSGGRISSSDADLDWDYGDGLHSFQSLGWGPAKAPTPEQCRDLATSRATGKIEDTKLRKGLRFCIQTSKGNVAWVRLVRIDRDPEDPGQSHLYFVARVWLKTAKPGG